MHVRGTGIDALHLQNCFCIVVNLNSKMQRSVRVCVCISGYAVAMELEMVLFIAAKLDAAMLKSRLGCMCEAYLLGHLSRRGVH